MLSLALSLSLPLSLCLELRSGSSASALQRGAGGAAAAHQRERAETTNARSGILAATTNARSGILARRTKAGLGWALTWRLDGEERLRGECGRDTSAMAPCRRAASCPGETAGETAWVEMVQQRPRQKGRKVFSGGHLALRRGNRRAGVREEVVAHVAAMRGPGRDSRGNSSVSTE